MVIEYDEKVTRTAVENNPGWVKVRNKSNNSYWYISPDGRQVSAREYKELYEKYGTNIPAGVIKGMTTPKAGFINDVGAATRPQEHPERQTPPPPKQATDTSRMEWVKQTSVESDHPVMDTLADIADKIPDPAPPSNRSYKSNPSEKEIADGLTSIILFAAAIAAIFTDLESLMKWNKPMVDQATVPFMRIAKKHGWLNDATARVVAEGDDWSQLGKGLAAMIFPVIMEIQLKHARKMEEIRLKNQQPVTNQPASNPVASNGHQPSPEERAWVPGMGLTVQGPKTPPGVIR